jgi:hypothetical protein
MAAMTAGALSITAMAAKSTIVTTLSAGMVSSFSGCN